MARSAAALARRQERTELRQDQVLDAAQDCFLAKGFHRASMSAIAAGAGMSVGHIYQYFENKEAIIIAICERRFAKFEDLLLAAEEQFEGDYSPLLEAWTAHFTWWIEPVRAPLTLEIMSEAGRNPKVAAVVAKIDRRFRDMLRRSLLPFAGPLSEEEIENRIEAVVMVSHGMTSRMTADRTAEPERLIAAFRLTVQKLIGSDTSERTAASRS